MINRSVWPLFTFQISARQPLSANLLENVKLAYVLIQCGPRPKLPQDYSITYICMYINIWPRLSLCIIACVKDALNYNCELEYD